MINFYLKTLCSTILHSLSHQKKKKKKKKLANDESFIAHLMPFLLKGLKSKCLDYKRATYLILSHLSNVFTFQNNIKDEILNVLSKVRGESLHSMEFHSSDFQGFFRWNYQRKSLGYCGISQQSKSSINPWSVRCFLLINLIYFPSCLLQLFQQTLRIIEFNRRNFSIIDRCSHGWFSLCMARTITRSCSDQSRWNSQQPHRKNLEHHEIEFENLNLSHRLFYQTIQSRNKQLFDFSRIDYRTKVRSIIDKKDFNWNWFV